MESLKSIVIATLSLLLLGCANFSNEKSIGLSMVDDSGIIKLDSIIIGSDNTKAIMEIMAGKEFWIFAPGTNNCYFFFDPITKKEYNLLRVDGIKVNQEVRGPLKFTLIFEKIDVKTKLIHMVGGKEAFIEGGRTVGFYDISLEN